MANEKKRDLSIMLVRIVAMSFIFIDHWAAYVEIPLKSVIIQITNSGVLIFLFISGFLYGGKSIADKKSWLIGRFKRLIVPYWIFLVMYFLLATLRGAVKIRAIFVYVFVLQGILGTDGGPHTLWFMTLLFMCYLILPILQFIRGLNLNKKIGVLSFLAIIALQVSLSYKCNITLDFGHPLSWYVVAFFVFSLGYFSNGWIMKNKLSVKFVVFFTAFMVLGCLIRVLGQKYLDGTVIYDRIISVWTNAILDIWIFVIIRVLANRYERIFNYKFIQKIDAISYPFYLVHATVLGEIAFLASKSIVLFFLVSLICSYVGALIINAITYLVLEKSKIIVKTV